jgi:uncharacterized protein (TIGR02453 family)
VSSAEFSGFAPEAFAFLAELAERQDRGWFKAHKAIYDDAVRAPMVALLAELSAALAAHQLPLRADPARAIFRVQRDVRFARDKRPYKPHISAVLSRDGARQSAGILYVHVDPAGSFASCGFYLPHAPLLDAMRARMVERPKDYLAALAQCERGGLVFSQQDALKRTPSGFPTNLDPRIETALRLKSHIARIALPAAMLGDGPALVRHLVTVAQAGEKLLKFGWSCVTVD